MPEAGNWKPYNDKALIKNIDLVFKTGDIEKLSKSAYNFINTQSGFIAHYDLYGFKDYYQDLRDFTAALLSSFTEHDANRDETDGDFIKWYGQAYCSSKARAKKGIADVIRKHLDNISEDAEINDSKKLTNLSKLLDEVINRDDPELSKSLVSNLGI